MPLSVRARAYVAAGAVLVLLVAGGEPRQPGVDTRRVRGNASSAFEWPSARAASTWRGPSVLKWGWSLLEDSPWRWCSSAWTRDLVLWLVPAGLASASNDYGQIASFASLDIDGGVTAVVAVLALLTMAGASVLATRASLRGDLVSTLKSGGDRSSTRGPGLGERALLVVQVAASLGLIASAGLVLKSVIALDRVNPGFDGRSHRSRFRSRKIWRFNVRASARYWSIGCSRDFATSLAWRRSRPASARRLARAARGSCSRSRAVPKRSPIRCRRGGIASAPITSPRWAFRSCAAAVLRPTIGAAARPVVTINQAAARRYFPDQDPIGRRITLPEVIDGDPAVAEIVGVVGDVSYWPPDEAPGPDVYQPALQFSHPYTTVMVRVSPEQWRRIDVRTFVGPADVRHASPRAGAGSIRTCRCSTP